jgi:hypothetical protein
MLIATSPDLGERRRLIKPDNAVQIFIANQQP